MALGSLYPPRCSLPPAPLLLLLVHNISHGPSAINRRFIQPDQPKTDARKPKGSRKQAIGSGSRPSDVPFHQYSWDSTLCIVRVLYLFCICIVLYLDSFSLCSACRVDISPLVLFLHCLSSPCHFSKFHSTGLPPQTDHGSHSIHNNQSQSICLYLGTYHLCSGC